MLKLKLLWQEIQRQETNELLVQKINAQANRELQDQLQDITLQKFHGNWSLRVQRGVCLCPWLR